MSESCKGDCIAFGPAPRRAGQYAQAWQAADEDALVMSSSGTPTRGDDVARWVDDSGARRISWNWDFRASSCLRMPDASSPPDLVAVTMAIGELETLTQFLSTTARF